MYFLDKSKRGKRKEGINWSTDITALKLNSQSGTLFHITWWTWCLAQPLQFSDTRSSCHERTWRLLRVSGNCNGGLVSSAAAVRLDSYRLHTSIESFQSRVDNIHAYIIYYDIFFAVSGIAFSCEYQCCILIRFCTIYQGYILLVVKFRLRVISCKPILKMITISESWCEYFPIQITIFKDSDINPEWYDDFKLMNVPVSNISTSILILILDTDSP